MPEFLIAFILGLVEGATEFIPVSSTGHLILVGHLLNFTGERAETFETFIQLGAILAVVVLYRQRFVDLLHVERREGFNGLRGIGLLFLTMLPAVIGAIFRDEITQALFNPLMVAIGLAVGGGAILVIERFPPAVRLEGLDGLTWREALGIGLFQLLALWPGVSRSAATILGGMLIGVKRDTAAEYSFLVAVPALFAASALDIYRSLDVLQASDIPVFAVGFIVAFVSALIAVRLFIRLISTHTLAPFGWYRLALAAVVLIVLL